MYNITVMQNILYNTVCGVMNRCFEYHAVQYGAEVLRAKNVFRSVD